MMNCDAFGTLSDKARLTIVMEREATGLLDKANVFFLHFFGMTFAGYQQKSSN